MIEQRPWSFASCYWWWWIVICRDQIFDDSELVTSLNRRQHSDLSVSFLSITTAFYLFIKLMSAALIDYWLPNDY